ncbi:hypothetical protein BDP81DRAFT_450284 [Colletotrichum phormii]|uniref:Uncharacterized protein n=1 Tax=Colletotrichum phormii TaxID=359342 RepID=A0AAI9ZSV3_9PEZI|nr:uncharacterized protein BDP81DRAFT_450284 [Colletotrichum phormii]KAK1636393.1 hypothetical protein BDP81DRAFT_450284 [Colletotrichum phormii]
MDTDVGDGTRVEVMKEELVVDPVTEVTPFVVETSVRIVGDGICDGEESCLSRAPDLRLTPALLVIGSDAVLVAKFENEACVIEEAEFETKSRLLVNWLEDDTEIDGKVVFGPNSVRDVLSLVEDEARDVVLREVVMSVNEGLLLDGRLVGRSDDVPLEVDVKAVVESEEVKVTTVLVLDTSSDPGMELLLNVGISADEREVVGRREVSERELVDDRELVNDTELADETGLLEDKDEVNNVVTVEFELVGYVEELERLVERAVVEIKLLDSSVVEKVKIVELEVKEEVEEDSEFVETIKVDKVFEVVVPVADVDGVSESEEVKELVVFANGPPVDVEKVCVLLLTPRLVIVDDEDVVDSEEVEEDDRIEVDEVSKGVDEPELEAKEEVEVIEELDKDNDEEEVENEVKEIREEVKDNVEDVSVVDSRVEEEVEEEVKDEDESETEEDVVGEVEEELEEEVEVVSVVESEIDEDVEEELKLVEDEFDKKVKDKVSVLDSELEDVVDDVLDSVDSVVVGAGGTSRKP